MSAQKAPKRSKRTRPTQARATLLGLLGVAAVYSVYYLRNLSSVQVFMSDKGAIQCLLALLALLVVGIVGGVWAALNRPQSELKALSLGLAAPAIIFGVDLSLLRPNVTPLSMALAPASAMEAIRAGASERNRAEDPEIGRLQNKIATLNDEVTRLRSTANSLEKEVNDWRVRASRSESQLERTLEDLANLREQDSNRRRAARPFLRDFELHVNDAPPGRYKLWMTVVSASDYDLKLTYEAKVEVPDRESAVIPLNFQLPLFRETARVEAMLHDTKREYAYGGNTLDPESGRIEISNRTWPAEPDMGRRRYDATLTYTVRESR